MLNLPGAVGDNALACNASSTGEAKKCFENLDLAYIHAKYRISESDLRYFADRVHLLLTQTESRCQSFLYKLPDNS